MAEKDELNEIEPVAMEPQAPIKASLMGRLSVLLILAALVAFECVVAYFLMPQPLAVARRAEDIVAGDTDDPTLDDLEDQMESDSASDIDAYSEDDLAEADLGNYSVSTFLEGTNTTLRFTFHLWGLVEEEEKDDFMLEFESRENRIRERVFQIIKKSELEDIKDPSLSLIKRQILTTINKVFGKKIVKEVMMTDVSDTQI